MNEPDSLILGLGNALDDLMPLADVPCTNGPASTVWLAPNACLMRSHLSQPEDEPTVVNVVGAANCDSLSGWVLMLG